MDQWTDQWTEIARLGQGQRTRIKFGFICSPPIMPPAFPPGTGDCSLSLSPCHPLSLRFQPIETSEKSSLPSRTFLEEEEEESPRAGSCRPPSRVAGSGPNTKVIKQSNMQPSLTDDKPLHVNRPPGPTADFRGDTNAAEGRDTPYGVNQGHNEDKDPGATDDRRELPGPRPPSLCPWLTP